MGDAETIASRREAWLAAFVAEDIPTMSQFLTEDHLTMAPNQPQRVGVEAAKEFWQEGFSAAKTAMTIHSQDLTVAGDVAIDRFNWEMRITPHGEGETLEDKGGCLWIWRRGDDGTWRMATAIWNSDLAEPGAWSGE